jgi:hypothetical protein
MVMFKVYLVFTRHCLEFLGAKKVSAWWSGVGFG